MANIELTGVYRQMQRRFSVEGAGLTRFEEDFIASVNMATRRINKDADLETRIDMVTATTDTVGLDDAYLDVLFEVAAVYMAKMGQRPARGDEEDMVKSENDIPMMINSIRRDILNRAQAADTDDTAMLVGLGGLGD